MLSTETRLKVEFLCDRIEKGQPIPLVDMAWLQKWADRHRTVNEMVNKARRRAISGGSAPDGSMDAFLDDLNIGDPDPSNHLTGESSIDDFVSFFKSPNWMRRD